MDRLPPHDLDSEESVLGSILIDDEAIYKVASSLRPEDFYREKNGWIYAACLALQDRNEAINQVTVAYELSLQDRLESAGGPEYLGQLVANVPTSLHVEYFAGIVQSTAQLRRLISAAGRIAQIAYEGGPDVDSILGQAEELLFSLRRSGAARDFVHIREILDHYFEETAFGTDEESGHLSAIPTGFVDLDRLLGGFQRSDLIILAARPSLGKSSFALNIAQNAAIQNRAKIAIFSLEMSKEQIGQRLLSSEAGVDSQRLRLNAANDSEQRRILEATGILSEAPIWVDDSPLIRLTELRSKSRRLASERGLDLIVVDYLQLIQGTSKNDNRVQEISLISRSLKALARELNVPVLALSQLSRAVESRTPHVPMLSDLRESGCLAGETPVYLPDSGTYRPIADLVGQTDFRVLAVNPETWQLEPRRVLNAFATGRKPVFRLTTRLGRSIRATANHQFLSVTGWQRLDALSPGTRIALPRRLPSPSAGTMADACLALLGHLIGDGCTLPRHAIQYTTNDPGLAEQAANLAAQAFGDAVMPRIRQERGWYQVYLSAAVQLARGVRNPIAKWLDGLGVFGLRSHEKYVPDEVFAQSESGIALFLRHLWATDGCINLSDSLNHYTNVYYASSSPRLAKNVQSLLLRLGINAILAQRAQPNKGRDQYHVIVSGKPDVESFFQQVGGLGRLKSAHQAAITAYIQGRRENTNRDVVPRDCWKLHAVPAMQAAGLTTRQMQARLGMAYCGTTLYKANLSRERAARVARVVGSEELRRLATSEVYWDEIVTIEPDGEAEVYDLTVEGLHNFVAADICVHNSIEQDADVVMFIYRDDVYYTVKEWEKNYPTKPYPKGIADIIVAKHRNGPTGQISLLFFDKTTKFVNLEVGRE